MEKKEPAEERALMDKATFEQIVERAEKLSRSEKPQAEQTGQIDKADSLDQAIEKSAGNEQELGLQELDKACRELGIEPRHLALAVAQIRVESGSVWINGQPWEVARFMVSEMVRGLKGKYLLQEPLPGANQSKPPVSEASVSLSGLGGRSEPIRATFVWKEGPGAQFSLAFLPAPEGGTEVKVDCDFTRIQSGISRTGLLAGVFLGGAGLVFGLPLGGPAAGTICLIMTSLGFLLGWSFRKAGIHQMSQARERVVEMVKSFKTIYEVSKTR